MLMCQTHLKISGFLLYLFKNGVKPNFTLSTPGNFKAKALGFTRSLIDAVYLERVVFFYDFHGFSGIRSTQPTVLKTPKLTPMVPFPNRTGSFIVESENIFTLRGRTLHYIFVGAG